MGEQVAPPPMSLKSILGRPAGPSRSRSDPARRTSRHARVQGIMALATPLRPAGRRSTDSTQPPALPPPPHPAVDILRDTETRGFTVHHTPAVLDLSARGRLITPEGLHHTGRTPDPTDPLHPRDYEEQIPALLSKLLEGDSQLEDDADSSSAPDPRDLFADAPDSMDVLLDNNFSALTRQNLNTSSWGVLYHPVPSPLDLDHLSDALRVHQGAAPDDDQRHLADRSCDHQEASSSTTSPESTKVPPACPAPRPPKPRTRSVNRYYTRFQRAALTSAFQANPYVGRERHHHLATRLGTTAAHVKAFFQNERTKLWKWMKKQGKDTQMARIRTMCRVSTSSAPSSGFRTSPTFTAPSVGFRTSPTFTAPSVGFRTSPTFTAPSVGFRTSPTFTAPSVGFRTSPTFTAPSVVGFRPSLSPPELQAAPWATFHPHLQQPTIVSYHNPGGVPYQLYPPPGASRLLHANHRVLQLPSPGDDSARNPWKTSLASMAATYSTTPQSSCPGAGRVLALHYGNPFIRRTLFPPGAFSGVSNTAPLHTCT